MAVLTALFASAAHLVGSAASARFDIDRPGRIGRKLGDDEKYALIEYLKTANYDNYPRIEVAEEQGLPCANDKDWPERFSVRPGQ
jgi:hypothetical protein